MDIPEMQNELRELRERLAAMGESAEASGQQSGEIDKSLTELRARLAAQQEQFDALAAKASFDLLHPPTQPSEDGR
jgi:hypothetical protein